MPNKIDLSTLQSLIGEVESHSDMRPIQNMEVGCHYQYLNNGDLFSKSFIFEVLKDIDDYYLILIEGQIEHQLHKSFELIDSINQGNIYRIEPPKLKQ